MSGFSATIDPWRDEDGPPPSEVFEPEVHGLIGLVFDSQSGAASEASRRAMKSDRLTGVGYVPNWLAWIVGDPRYLQAAEDIRFHHDAAQSLRDSVSRDW